MIEILYTKNVDRLSKRDLIYLSGKLPVIFQRKIWRYRRWQDRQAALLSKLLLQKCLNRYGYPSNYLSRMIEDEYGRPFFDNHLDFNISHSGDYVLCAITNSCRLGIDIEQIKPISLTDFDGVLTAEQSENIRISSDVYKEFFKIWTSNESLLKADGRGLSISLHEINISGEKAKLFNSIWFLKEIDIDPNYCCHLATNIKNQKISMKEIKSVSLH